MEGCRRAVLAGEAGSAGGTQGDADGGGGRLWLDTSPVTKVSEGGKLLTIENGETVTKKLGLK